jgi:hypothetical protein
MFSNNVAPPAVLTIIIPVFNKESHISVLAGGWLKLWNSLA